MTLPANHVINETGHVSDHNAMAAAVNQNTTDIAARIKTADANAAYVPQSSVAGRFVAAAANPLLGGAGTIMGGNVVPTPTQVATGATAWAKFWQGIANNDGTFSWVQQQVQALKSNATRGSSVRIVGCSGGIAQGFYSRAQYIAAWLTVIDYCAANGVTVYPALASSWNDFGAGSATAAFPSAADITDMAAVAVALSGRGNVIAFDVVQEYGGTFPAGKVLADAQTVMASLCAAIRAAGVATPLTGSNPAFSLGNWNDYGLATEVAMFDFIDRHVYYDAAPTHPTAMYSTMPDGMPVMIGEAGINVAASGAARTARFQAIRSILRGGRVVGCYAWAIADQDTVTSNEWGMYSGSPGGTLTARSDVCPTFLTWPRTRERTAIHKYMSADVALGAGSNTSISLDTTAFDCGGLGNGSSNTTAFTINAGMGGLYRVTFQIGITAGGTAGAFDANIYDGTGANSICEVQGVFGAGDGKTQQTSIEVDLPAGFVALPKIFTTQAMTLTSGIRRTFVSAELLRLVP